jgi:ABC-2 type transporter
MTSITTPADTILAPHRSKLSWAVADALSVARRNIIGMTRRPQVLAFATIQPVIFVLIFRYVFGSSIHIPRVRYVDYLMPAIFVQTVMFGAQGTAVGMAEDLHNGLIERFRSVVMARSAVLFGRVLADALLNLFGIVLMLGVGYLVGFRLHTDAPSLLAAVGVLLLFGLAISTVTALLGWPPTAPRQPPPRRSRSPCCSRSPRAPSCQRGQCPTHSEPMLSTSPLPRPWTPFDRCC